MSNKYQVIALIGQTGAGKSAIQRASCELHPALFNKIVGCTTRPIREDEIQGVHYNFISLLQFTHQVLNGDMIEATEFNDWFYGTTIDQLAPDKINIGVFNPIAVEALLEDPRLDVMTILVEASDKTRLIRCLNREKAPDCDEICRRYFEDKKDFANIDFGYTLLTNENGSSLDLLAEDHPFREDLEYMWNGMNKEIPFHKIAFADSQKSSTEGENE